MSHGTVYEVEEIFEKIKKIIEENRRHGHPSTILIRDNTAKVEVYEQRLKRH